MKLLVTSESIENLERILNEYLYSNSYEILDGKVMYMYNKKYIENDNLKYLKKGQKHQIYQL